MSYKLTNQIRHEIASEKDLSTAAALICYALSSIFPEAGKPWRVSQERLMAATNRSRNTVKKGLRELEAKGVIKNSGAGEWLRSESGKAFRAATEYTWTYKQAVSVSEGWQSGTAKQAETVTVRPSDTPQEVTQKPSKADRPPSDTPGELSQFDTLRGSQFEQLKDPSKELTLSIKKEEEATKTSSHLELLQSSLVKVANRSHTHEALAEAIASKPDEVLAQVELMMKSTQIYNPQKYLATVVANTPERLLPVKRSSPYVPDSRAWVEQHHNLGEHFACRAGEFGHPQRSQEEEAEVPLSEANKSWLGGNGSKNPRRLRVAQVASQLGIEIPLGLEIVEASELVAEAKRRRASEQETLQKCLAATIAWIDKESLGDDEAREAAKDMGVEAEIEEYLATRRTAASVS